MWLAHWACHKEVVSWTRLETPGQKTSLAPWLPRPWLKCSPGPSPVLLGQSSLLLSFINYRGVSHPGQRGEHSVTVSALMPSSWLSGDVVGTVSRSTGAVAGMGVRLKPEDGRGARWGEGWQERGEHLPSCRKRHRPPRNQGKGPARWPAADLDLGQVHDGVSVSLSLSCGDSIHGEDPVKRAWPGAAHQRLKLALSFP